MAKLAEQAGIAIDEERIAGIADHRERVAGCDAAGSRRTILLGIPELVVAIAILEFAHVVSCVGQRVRRSGTGDETQADEIARVSPRNVEREVGRSGIRLYSIRR